MTTFLDSFSEEIWFQTYKHHSDNSVDDTIRRVATAIASVEITPELQQEWTEKFIDMMSDFKVVPGGRIIVNSGTEFEGSTLLNCFVSPRLKYDIDSIDGIYKHLWMQSKTLKSEGGWGENFSYIRPRGSFIEGVGVESPGAVKFMELFDKSSEIVTSGSGKKSTNKRAKNKIRKGAQMSVMDVWHPDVIEFITAKQTQGRLTKFNMSVNCTDEFMKKLEFVEHWKNEGASKEYLDEIDKWDLKFPDTTHPNYKEEWTGDIKKWENSGYPVNVHQTVSATWLWNLIMKSTYTRAEPGVLFLDRANYYNPLSYRETIYATNPSMPAGTLVHTKTGIFEIQDLENKEFLTRSLDGSWNISKCFKSGENKSLKKIYFDDSGFKFLRSTHEHKWPVLDQRMDRIYRVKTSDLKVGDLIPLNLNESFDITGDNTLTKDEGFLVGYLVGDGWFSKRTDGSGYAVGFVFNENESAMADKILSIINKMKNRPSTITQSTKDKCQYIQFTDSDLCDLLINRYGLVPGEKNLPTCIWTSNDEFIKGFVDGLFSTDGHVGINSQHISVKSSRKHIIEQFAKLLSFVGIKGSVWESEPASNVLFPNGKTYDKTYYSWNYKINGNQVLRFAKIFDISHHDKKKKLEHLCSNQGVRYMIDNDYMRITKIEDCESADVWDISVYHEQHIFPVEWCYTGNCGEQVLAPAGCCDLGSLNLTQFVKDDLTDYDYPKMKKYLSYLVRFLDNVNTYSNAPLPEYKENMMKKRRIGCGLMGWGSSLLMMKVRFSSEKSQQMRDKLMKFFSHTAYESSIDLAEEKGMFELCDPELHAQGPFLKQIEFPAEQLDRLRKHGIRNSAVLSCQPTGNCQTPKAIIQTKNGNKSIESIASENGYNIWEMEKNSIIKLIMPLIIPTIEGDDIVEEIYVNGIDEIIPLILKTGDVLKQTANHRYLVKINDEYADWVYAKDLRPGMKIITVNK